MTLHLRDLCTAIADLTVSNGAQNVPIYDIQDVRRAYADESLPVCLVLSADDQAPGEFQPLALDSSGYIVWSIQVLFLQAPVEQQGLGWQPWAESVTYFAENFVQALVDAKDTFCGLNTMLIGISARRGVYEYPSQSGNLFYGALFTPRFNDYTRIA